jgi:Fe-S-cluster containining protein
MVWLNPWELARLAAVKGLTARVFRDRHCEFGGIRLHFNGPIGRNGLAACSQYLPDCGCSVHADRPMACRLYPLGRERHGKKFHYMHRGSDYPCLEDCPKVADLPHLTVADYLVCQDVSASVAAQDAYLELMQALADGAFALLLESGLAASGDRLTLRLWRELGRDNPEHLTKRLGPEWIDRLMLPGFENVLDDPATFSRRHHDMLQSQAQESFGNIGDFATHRD